MWDAALLVDSGGHKNMDCAVVAVPDTATELARLPERDGLAEVEARDSASRARCKSRLGPVTK